jgi:DNA-binding transcriptional regulator YdaS (Cro superfamily)
VSNIKKSIALIGGQTITGSLLGVPQKTVSNWVNVSGYAPAKYIKKISKLTEGKITVEELLADHEKPTGTQGQSNTQTFIRG